MWYEYEVGGGTIDGILKLYPLIVLLESLQLYPNLTYLDT